MASEDRTVVIDGTGQPLYPAIEFEDGSWYRAESKEMARTISEGRLTAMQLRVAGQALPAAGPRG